MGGLRETEGARHEVEVAARPVGRDLGEQALQEPLVPLAGLDRAIDSVYSGHSGAKLHGRNGREEVEIPNRDRIRAEVAHGGLAPAALMLDGLAAALDAAACGQ